MSIDPNTLPEDAVVEANAKYGAALGPMTVRYLVPTDTITRVFVPVPDGMTLADAEAALADAGAWVGVIDPAHCPDGARMMNRWTNGLGGDNLYVHRDDLPPTDPDAELVEAIAADLDKAWKACRSWDYEVQPAPVFSDLARAALAVVREHEAAR